MTWVPVSRADVRARKLADRHYSRRQIGTPQFAPAAKRTLVLLWHDDTAVWVSQAPEYRMARTGGVREIREWVCTLFRNEGAGLSSDLIRLAVGHTANTWGEVPAGGFVTFVDPDRTRHKRDPGRCFRKAGWLPDGITGGGYVRLRLPACNIHPIAVELGPLFSQIAA